MNLPEFLDKIPKTLKMHVIFGEQNFVVQIEI